MSLVGVDRTNAIEAYYYAMLEHNDAGSRIIYVDTYCWCDPNIEGFFKMLAYHLLDNEREVRMTDIQYNELIQIREKKKIKSIHIAFERIERLKKEGLFSIKLTTGYNSQSYALKGLQMFGNEYKFALFTRDNKFLHKVKTLIQGSEFEIDQKVSFIKVHTDIIDS